MRRRGKDDRIRCLGELAVGGNTAMAGHIHRWSRRSNYSHDRDRILQPQGPSAVYSVGKLGKRLHAWS